MSIVMNLAPLVDTTLLSMILISSILAVGVSTSSVKFVRLPPNTNLDRFSSSFCGWTEHSNFPYVTSLKSANGTCLLWMKKQVFVGAAVRPPTPWNNRPNSFADDNTQSATTLGSGWLMSCRYFNISPILSSITAIAVSKMAEGKCLLASHRGLQSTPPQSVAVANANANAVVPRIWERVLYAGPVGPLFCWDLVLDAIGAGAFFCWRGRFDSEVSRTLGAAVSCTLRAAVSCTLGATVSCTLGAVAVCILGAGAASTLEGGGSIAF